MEQTKLRPGFDPHAAFRVEYAARPLGGFAKGRALDRGSESRRGTFHLNKLECFPLPSVNKLECPPSECPPSECTPMPHWVAVAIDFAERALYLFLVFPGNFQ